MKRKKIVSFICVIILSLGMTGCSGKNVLDELFSNNGDSQPIIVQQEKLEDEQADLIQKPNPEYNAEAELKVDFKTIAKLYVQNQQKKEARDILEAGYQLEQDVEVYQMLQELTVNAAEEEEMAAQLDLLIQNLER